MDLTDRFREAFQQNPVMIARAPGRVNLLGEHVDYNEGVVLPAAIDREVRLAVRSNGSMIVRLQALDLNERVEFDLMDLEKKTNLRGADLPHWAHYPAGVAWALKEAGFEPQGIDAVYTSNVPIGSGLSSSAAVEVAFAAAWQELGGWSINRMRLAQLCQRAENAYLGVASGLMDQFASAHGITDHCLRFDTRSLDWEPVPLPPGTALVIADSGMRRTLAGSAYNERRASCEEAVRLLKQFLPDIHSLRDVKPTEFAAYSEFLPEIPRKRADHIVHEIARVESAVTALRTGRTRSFGALMFAGHASLRDLYEVSLPELDALVEIARGTPGILGARLTGAGFGGCTVNLVEQQHAQEFIEKLAEGYRRHTGRTAPVYLCRASDGASVKRI
jgi:galactokinase